MKLKRWALGAVVALGDGFINGAIIWALAPDTPFKATCAILIYNAGRAIKDFIAKHPFDSVTMDNTTTFTNKV